jgi:hypothetical protein
MSDKLERIRDLYRDDDRDKNGDYDPSLVSYTLGSEAGNKVDSLFYRKLVRGEPIKPIVQELEGELTREQFTMLMEICADEES